MPRDGLISATKVELVRSTQVMHNGASVCGLAICGMDMTICASKERQEMFTQLHRSPKPCTHLNNMLRRSVCKAPIRPTRPCEIFRHYDKYS